MTKEEAIEAVNKFDTLPVFIIRTHDEALCIEIYANGKVRGWGEDSIVIFNRIPQYANAVAASMCDDT